MNRRSFLAGILAAGVAPYVVTSSGILMPVRKILSAGPFYGTLFVKGLVPGEVRAVIDGRSWETAFPSMKDLPLLRAVDYTKIYVSHTHLEPWGCGEVELSGCDFSQR